MTRTSTIGIDPALTNIGIYQICRASDPLKADLWTEALIQTGALRGAERLEFIARKVEYELKRLACGLVVLESYNYKGHNLAELGEVMGVIKMLTARFSLRLVMASPALVKKFATGSSQATKEQMMSRYNMANEHLADARALAELGQVILRGGSTKRCEIEAARAVLTPPKKKRAAKGPWDKDKPLVAI